MFTILVIGRSVFFTQSFDKVTLVIGRMLESDIVLPDPTVSRRHCRIHAETQDFSLENLRSTNGCTIDGVVVEGRAKVLPHQEIRIGTYALYLQHGHANIGRHLGQRSLMNGNYSEDLTAQFKLPPSAQQPAAITQPRLDDPDEVTLPAPTRASLRRLIDRIFINDSELDAFFVDYFLTIRTRFAGNMDRISKVTLLLERVHSSEILRCLCAANTEAVATYKDMLSYEAP